MFPDDERNDAEPNALLPATTPEPPPFDETPTEDLAPDTLPENLMADLPDRSVDEAQEAVVVETSATAIADVPDQEVVEAPALALITLPVREVARTPDQAVVEADDPIVIRLPEPQRAAMPLIIKGSMKPEPWHSRMPRRRPRPLAMQGAVTAISLCVIVMALVATVTISDPSLAAMPGQAFNALASSFAVKSADSFTLYRVRPGDTIEGIAHRFNVSIGGIYELNKMYTTTEITIGQVIKIPNDPSYGVNFKPSAPPTPPPAVAPPLIGNAPPGTIYNSSCMYCAVGGNTTGGGPCAPHASTITGFGLGNPNPNSHWVRGYTWYHSGVDISTGQYGTPVIAAQSGQVIFSAWDSGGGGLSVKVNHCWGLATSYSHMERILVSLGQYVYKGQIVGLQGSTGNSTGPHVHFMTWWDNNPFDPLCAYGTIDGVSSSSHYGGCP